MPRRFVPDPGGELWWVDVTRRGWIVTGRLTSEEVSEATGHALRRDGRHVSIAIPNAVPSVTPLTTLFVYGSLRRGGQYHHLLDPHDVTFVDTSTTHGQLVDLGEYPGLIRDGDGDGVVVGELYHVADVSLEALLTDLDRLEDFGGYDDPNAPYRRIIVITPLGPAWSYLLLQGHRGRGFITSGDWMAE